MKEGKKKQKRLILYKQSTIYFITVFRNKTWFIYIHIYIPNSQRKLIMFWHHLKTFKTLQRFCDVVQQILLLLFTGRNAE